VFAPAFSVKAVDTTAAGDAFTAALAMRWGTVPIMEALRFANATGALAATVAGAQPSMPTLAAVEAFLAAQP
jgi:ribokinase